MLGTLFSAGPLLLLGFVLYTSIFVVRAKSNEVVERFGKFHSIRQPGLNVKLPFPIDRVVSRVSLQVQELNSELGVKSKDNVFITLPVAVQLKVAAGTDSVRDAFYELDNPNVQLKSYVMNRIRSAINGLELQEIYDDKEKITSEVKAELEVQFAGFGYEIVDVLIDEPQVSPEVRASFDRVISSKRHLESAENEAQANKTLQVRAAEAAAEAMALNGKGIADQRAAIANGFKEDFNKIKAAMPGGADDLVAAHLTQIYTLEALKDASNNHGTTVLMPYEAMSGVGAQATVLDALQASRVSDPT